VTLKEKLSFQLSGAAAIALLLINGVSNAKVGKDQQHYTVVVHGRSQAQKNGEEGHMTGAECWVSVGEGYFEQLTAVDALSRMHNQVTRPFEGMLPYFGGGGSERSVLESLSSGVEKI
jgi:hypothetical protein